MEDAREVRLRWSNAFKTVDLCHNGINLAFGPNGNAGSFLHSRDKTLQFKLPQSSSSSLLRPPLHLTALRKSRSDVDFSQLNARAGTNHGDLEKEVGFVFLVKTPVASSRMPGRRIANEGGPAQECVAVAGIVLEDGWTPH